MAKVRFLQSTILLSTGKTYGFNDEEFINDEKLVESLVKNEVVDILEEQKPQPKAQKRVKKEADVDAK